MTGQLASPAPVLLVEGLGVVFRAPSRDFSVFIDHMVLGAGEKLVLQAPSGSGKSTVLALLGTAIRPDVAERFELRLPDGTVLDLARAWRDEDETTLRRARRDVFGFILQSGGLAPFLTVAENIAAPMLFARRRASGGQRDRLVATLAERLGIDALLALYPGQLSVGQRQRAAIARALVMGPRIVLADEPTASVDPDLAAEIDMLLAEAVDAGGAALVLASHRTEAAAWGNSPRAQVRMERGADMAASVFSHGRQAA